LEALGADSAFCGFFFLFKLKKINFGEHFAQFSPFREEENCVRSTRHAAAVPLVMQTFGGCLLS
jgi:hypothetical protein